MRVGLGRVYTLRVGTTPWPRLAAGESVDSHHVELATELVVRQSTARPPVSAAAAPTPKVR